MKNACSSKEVCTDMEIKFQSHIALVCNDVEQARVFYEAIGGEVIATIPRKTGDGNNYFMRVADGVMLEIQAPRAPEFAKETNVWEHLALCVDDCVAAAEKLESLGATIEKKPSNNKIGDKPIINSVILGPGGEKIELVQEL